MRVSGQGERVIQALATARAFRRVGDGWAAGPLRAPARLVEELAAGGLVEARGDALALTATGRARWARDRPRPNRLLAERPVADPAEASGGPRPAARTATVNLLESPLGWLRTRGMVDDRQYEAGERLRADWTMAGLSPRITMRWDASPTGGRRQGADAPLDPTLAGIAAKRRFEGAVEAAGKGLGDILWRVVCSGEGLETAEAALGWPRRAGKLVLLMALDRVADYYGIG
jgi:hypothetical protein